MYEQLLVTISTYLLRALPVCHYYWRFLINLHASVPLILQNLAGWSDQLLIIGANPRQICPASAQRHIPSRSPHNPHVEPGGSLEVGYSGLWVLTCLTQTETFRRALPHLAKNDRQLLHIASVDTTRRWASLSNMKIRGMVVIWDAAGREGVHGRGVFRQWTVSVSSHAHLHQSAANITGTASQ